MSDMRLGLLSSTMPIKVGESGSPSRSRSPPLDPVAPFAARMSWVAGGPPAAAAELSASESDENGQGWDGWADGDTTMAGVSAALDFPAIDFPATLIDGPEDEADRRPPEVPVALRALHAKENKLMTQKTERAQLDQEAASASASELPETLDMMIDRIYGSALRSAAVRLWKEAHEHWPLSIGDSPAALHAFANGDGKTFQRADII